jgi:hypothetical protein
VDGALLKDGSLTVGSGGAVATDTVSERTSAAGVTVDGVLLKDAGIVVGAGSASAPSIAPTGDSNTGIYFPAADTIAFSEGGVEALRLDASGNATFAGTAAMASSFLRNRLINGGMEIAQRATTATGTYNSVYVYASVDRWAVFSANSSTTQAQSTDAPSGFRNSFRLQRPSGNTGTNTLFVTQGIESVNCYDLSGQPVTISFWAKRGANYSGGNLSVSLITGTSADQGIAIIGLWAGRATPITTTTAITTTWTRYTFTGTVGSGVLEAAVEFNWTPSGTAGADDSVYITGVQLEVGTVATPFERRLFGQELALCQRYFYKSFNQATVPGTVGAGSYRGVVSTSGFRTSHSFQHAVTMRASPTIIFYNPVTGSAGSAYNDDTGANPSAIPYLVSDIGMSGVDLTPNQSPGNAVIITYTANAEL